jgi:LPXTG-site transpeptidase (sortase) family protein
MLLSAPLVLGIAAPASASAPSAYFVESTGHHLAEPFLSYWIQADGNLSLGMPVTDPVARGSRLAQYFEFGALVQRRDRTVTRIKVGRELLESLQHPDELVGGRRATASRSSSGLSGDPHQVPPEVNPSFLSFYEQQGGEAALGKPLTPAYSTRRGTTQWFEYGRIESAGAAASLAPVGLELAVELGLDTKPLEQGDLPPFDPERFHRFAGDGTIREATGPFDPVTLQIPRIRVNAAVEQTQIVDGALSNPVNAWNVGWYPALSRPGEWTNVVISGHRDWWGFGPVVFWNLGYVQPGDKVYLLAADGTGATYVVSEVFVVPKDVNPQTIVDDVGYEALTLITCGGKFDGKEYADRIIVRAYRI